MINMNSGYCGYRMSNRAVEAYENNEKPISKWTKTEILNIIEEETINQNLTVLFDIELLQKLKTSDLKALCLIKSSWHHTGSYCNRTDFYKIDFERLETITNSDIIKFCECNKKETKEEPVSKKKLADVVYLEWYGTRKHPYSKEKTLKNVYVEEKGKFYYIYRNENFIMKKLKTCNGLNVCYL